MPSQSIRKIQQWLKRQWKTISITTIIVQSKTNIEILGMQNNNNSISRDHKQNNHKGSQTPEKNNNYSLPNGSRRRHSIYCSFLPSERRGLKTAYYCCVVQSTIVVKHVGTSGVGDTSLMIYQHFIPCPTMKRQLVLRTPTAAINGGTTLTAALAYQPPIPPPTS